MNYLKKHLTPIAEGIYLVILFFISQLPLRDFDIWFHLKSGELFVKQGQLTFTEVFSYTAQGREWTPFEWLFQVVSYLLSQFGLWILPPFIAIFVVIAHFFILRILDYIFGVKLLPRIFLSAVFLISTYEFNTVRPHTVAYTFLTITLFIILGRIFKNKKKWLYATPFLTLIWSNVHSTGFLSWGLMLAFAGTLFLQWLFSKHKETLLTIKDLLLFAGINFIVTLLPPMGILDYKLLWHFFQNREFLSVFIAEWAPPQDNPFGFRVYMVTVIVCIVAFIFTALKTKHLKRSLWSLPFLGMILGGYLVTRNVFLGSLGAIVLLGASVPYLTSWPKSKKVHLITWLGILFVLIGFYVWTYSLKQRDVTSNRLYYPVQSTEFAKRYLNGRMFNDYSYGGYILYHVYPRLQVHIDGRADVFLCCEMHDYLLLSYYKRLPDKEYRRFLNEYMDKYKVNFAIIATQKHNVMRRISSLLNTDPHWALVFWDDDSQVFVKRDGINDQIIQTLEAKIATPYLRDPYPSKKMDEALAEYERMNKIAPSARSMNVIGYIYMQKGKFQEAVDIFNKAINQDPTNESPYMNLAELAAKDGDLQSAIQLYRRALFYAGDRGLIYIRLGELIVQSSGNLEEAKKVWEMGVKNTVDNDAKKQLRELLTIQPNQIQPVNSSP